MAVSRRRERVKRRRRGNLISRRIVPETPREFGLYGATGRGCRIRGEVLGLRREPSSLRSRSSRVSLKACNCYSGPERLPVICGKLRYVQQRGVVGNLFRILLRRVAGSRLAGYSRSSTTERSLCETAFPIPCAPRQLVRGLVSARLYRWGVVDI